jgi:probable F420-dependent oxidoreductase
MEPSSALTQSRDGVPRPKPGFGIAIPFLDSPLLELREIVKEATDLGYGAVWAGESNYTDAFTPLTLTAAWQPQLALGTCVVPVQTRGPAVLAQSFAALAEATLAPVIAGVGASTPMVVADWNGADFGPPYQRVRDTLKFLRSAFTGAKIIEDYETFSVRGFSLQRPPTRPPLLMVAAGREAMLRLAGREGDGAIINWVSPGDVSRIAPIVHAAGAGLPTELAARIFVCPSTDTDTVRDRMRPFLAPLACAPGYREFFEWIGRGERLREVFQQWDSGQRRQAAASFPDDVIDEIIIHGPPGACREQLQAYLDAGVTMPSIFFIGIDSNEIEAMRALGQVGSLTVHSPG